MYAIVRVGGKQYHAEIGKTIVVEKLPYEVGHQLNFEEVLLISDGENTQIGQPFVSGVSVLAEIIEQFKGKKIVVFKYKPKIRYRRKQGHRQNYTRLLVHKIGDVGSQPVATEKKARPAKTAEAAVAAVEESQPVEKKPRTARKSAEAKASGEESKPVEKKARATRKITDAAESKPAEKKTRSTRKKSEEA
jgi:large subunit ribosomal protein L21